ncbi:MAG: hypothetical protein PHX78_10110 [bacterium]|nr:hypothetical protein [bacterium]
MGIAEGMKTIVENIVDSHKGRTKEINSVIMDTKNILKEAKTTLHDFSRERKTNASEQAKKLAGFTSDLTKNVGDMLKEFRENREEMSEEQSKNLGIFMGRLEDDVEKLKKGVSLMMNDFKKDREKSASELREKLAKEVTDIKAHVSGLLDEAEDLISGYRSDMVEAKKAWQGISSTLSKSGKAGIMAKIEAGEKITTVEKNAEKKPVENKTEKKAAKKKKK